MKVLLTEEGKEEKFHEKTEIHSTRYHFIMRRFCFHSIKTDREYSFMQGQPHQFKSPVFHWELDCESVLVLVAKLCLTLLRWHGL